MSLYRCFLVSVLLIISYSQASFAQEIAERNQSKGAYLFYTDTTHIFDTVYFNADASFTFEFTNTGAQTLSISSIKNTCGCNILSYTETVSPQQNGYISITYNTRRVGEFIKGITVYSNAENSPVIFYIEGIVTHNN